MTLIRNIKPDGCVRCTGTCNNRIVCMIVVTAASSLRSVGRRPVA